jgi:hypothetical protein
VDRLKRNGITAVRVRSPVSMLRMVMGTARVCDIRRRASRRYMRSRYLIMAACDRDGGPPTKKKYRTDACMLLSADVL